MDCCLQEVVSLGVGRPLLLKSQERSCVWSSDRTAWCCFCHWIITGAVGARREEEEVYSGEESRLSDGQHPTYFLYGSKEYANGTSCFASQTIKGGADDLITK